MYCADIRYILFSISILNDYEMFYAKLKYILFFLCTHFHHPFSLPMHNRATSNKISLARQTETLSKTDNQRRRQERGGVLGGGLRFGGLQHFDSNLANTHTSPVKFSAQSWPQLQHPEKGVKGW